MKNNIFKYTVLIAIISVSTFLLTLLVKIVLVGGIDLLSAFTSNSSRSDFDIGDFYESVRLGYSKTKPSQTDIFVIPSDTMSREDITAILLSIKNSTSRPAAIGLDFFFTTEQDSDSVLINTILSLGNVVLPTFENPIAENDTFTIKNQSYFTNISNGNFFLGFADLPYTNKTIRHYIPCRKSDGIVEDSFAAAIVKLYNPTLYEKCLSHSDILERISYPSFTNDDGLIKSIISLDNLENLNIFLKNASDHILLIGDVRNIGDVHPAVIGDMIPGVLIHASIVDTILNERYYKNVPSWITYLIALLLSLFTTVFLLAAKINLQNSGNLLFRILQFALIALLVYVGVILYIKNNIYFDITTPVLIMALSSLSFDIIYGILGLIGNLCAFKKLQKWI